MTTPEQPSTERLCPYCGVRPTASGDHVFLDFLGGTAKVRSCKACNDLFGKDFEAAVTSDLAPLIVGLSHCGYKHGRRVVFRRAWTDAEGIEYDVDSDRKATLSKPHIVRDVDGKVRAFTARRTEEARRMLQGFQAKGQLTNVVMKAVQQDGLQPPLRSPSIAVGRQMYRLAAKMCVAAAERVVPGAVTMDDVAPTLPDWRDVVTFTRAERMAYLRGP